MKHKYQKQRSVTPGWVDTLIAWLEFIGLIGGILAAIYGIITLFV